MDDVAGGREEGHAASTVLQTIVLPDERRADRLSLYIRYPKGQVRLAGKIGTPVEAGSILDFCTFFNAFSHRKWHELTGLRDLALRVAGSGTIGVTIATYHEGGAAWPLLRRELTLTREPLELRLPALGSFKGEVVALTITAGAADALLASAEWVTRDKPRRIVHLAAIITTFGREAAVRRSMATFSDTVCRGAPTGSVSLTVVDNGGELEASTLPGVRVVGNPNLGGAGGFARGLIEVMDAGSFTHALLMDDDAACEPESVWRTIAFLAYAISEKAAMAGAMMLNERPYLQYEKGAALDRRGTTSTPWITNAAMRDVSLLHEVCCNERDAALDFGGWWFFAFALVAVQALPFPFFVRGDDVDFSLSNRLKIVTLNGVATWCDSFGKKLGPSTEYLTYRAWLALTLMHGNRRAARRMLRFSLLTAERLAYRFDYRAMDAVLDSVQHVMDGPSSFTDQPAPLERLTAYRTGARVAVSLADFDRLRPQVWSGAPKVWAKLPFAGHILAPLSGYARSVRHARILWDFNRWGLGGAGKVVAGEGVDLQVFALDRRAFLDGLKRIARLRKLGGSLPDVQARYRSIGAPIRTRAYWEPLFRRSAPVPIHSADATGEDEAAGRMAVEPRKAERSGA